MSTDHAWALVAQREVSVRMRDRTFIISTLFSLLIIVGVFGFQAWQANQHSTYEVAVTATSAEMGEVLADRAAEVDDRVGVEITEVADATSARSAVLDDTADAWLTPTDDGWELVGRTEVDPQLLTVADTVIGQSVLEDNAARAGTDLATLQAGSVVTTDILDGDAQQRQVGTMVGFALAFLFYMAAVMFGTYLAMSVTEEKQSRIVEIIATSIPLRHLLVGKLVGAVALALMQMLLYAVVAVVGVSFTEWGDLLPSLTSGLVWFLLFFVVGFTMIAALYAVAGALASRQEDIQSTAMPVTILVMVMFFGAVLATGPVVEVLARVPPFSAILQPIRLVSGEGQWWQALISLGLLVVATGLVILLAERIYRRALMQTSGKLSVTQAWKAEI